MEQKNSSEKQQDVRIHITAVVPSKKFRRKKARVAIRKSRRKRLGSSHIIAAIVDATEDTKHKRGSQLRISERWLIIFLEVILASALIVVISTDWRVRNRYPMSLIVNVITLWVCLMEVMIIILTGSELEKLASTPLRMLMTLSLLFLQLADLVVQTFAEDEIVSAHLLLTSALCLVILFRIDLTCLVFKSPEEGKTDECKGAEDELAFHEKMRHCFFVFTVSYVLFLLALYGSPFPTYFKAISYNFRSRKYSEKRD